MIMESFVPPTLNLFYFGEDFKILVRSFIAFNYIVAFPFLFSNLQIIGSFERIIHEQLLPISLRPGSRGLGIS
jgi:hypothetical protein